MRKHSFFIEKYAGELFISLLTGTVVGALIAFWRDNNLAIPLCIAGTVVFKLYEIQRKESKKAIKNKE